MNSKEAQSLLQRYLQGKCSTEEQFLVERWYTELEQTGDYNLSDEQQHLLSVKMQSWLNEQMAKDVPVVSITPKQSSRRWMWAAASVAVLLLSTALWFWPEKAPDQIVAVTPINPENILAPNATIATVTLSNGKVVPLDSIGTTAMADVQGVKMVRLPSGELVYDSRESLAAGAEKFNTLSNPRGSRIATLVLADGSKVWLNAESSITYPVAFTNSRRQVSITGEAYFEVAKDASRPFTVKARQTEIAVLGTHFNINAFGDENNTRVTLLEGSVAVNAAKNKTVLKPGQQALVAEKIAVESDVDIEAIMAWKNGVFHFENAGIKQIMQEIGRWYDMNVIIESYDTKRKFGGEISRNSSLGQVLTILEESHVAFTVGQKTITVKAVP